MDERIFIFSSDSNKKHENVHSEQIRLINIEFASKLPKKEVEEDWRKMGAICERKFENKHVYNIIAHLINP